ncbi:MAG: class I tRNA ligase family protein, partial [Pirellulales bacterium]
FWEQRGYFHAEPQPGRPKFSIVIPPPNVTGALHLGHALNNTLQDIVVRRKRMQGFVTMWMPGTDHAGIATQAVVERRMFEEEGKTRHDVGREALVERIWKWKDAYEARILSQLKQIGASCDWQRTRFTFDDVCARAVRHFFFSLFKERLVYQGKKLVNWDTFLQTAVSDDELFHETVAGHFYHFRYPVIGAQPGEPSHVEIATTRPETMLGDTAVAVHPNPAAALAKYRGELEAKLVAASAKEKDGLRQQVETLDVRREQMLPQLERLRDMARAGRKVLLPLMDREIRLVCDEWAKPELGTGCVKITPAHDPNDYEVGKRQSLPMINILNPDGTMNAAAGKYEGLSIKDARKQVIADLDALGLLGEVEDRQIEMAHSDRSKTAIEPYLADQWFVKMETLAQMAMDAVSDGRVKIVPPRYAKGYLDWLGEKRDWPVSRQLWWGHRIPIWSRVENDEQELEDIEAYLDADPALEQGQLSYFVDRPREDESLTPEEKADLPFSVIQVCIQDEDPETEARIEELGFTQDPDVLDTWFSSALWPHSTLGWPEKTEALDYFYPTDLLSTSRDIITLWVARMVLAGLHNMGEVPFREVYIHPKILDGYGETMSKSKGNGIDPLDVQEKVGADSLRFGLAYLTTETQDVRMPAEFECPHCGHVMEQTKKNRMLPKLGCKQCGKEFSTQWAQTEADKALPRGAVVSERFELGRN